MNPESNYRLPLLPLRSKRVSELAVDQITGLIEEGQLKYGDRLPSEKELTAQLGISRASAREALRVLESQGLIEVRPGKGSYVTGAVPSDDITLELRAWFSNHREQFLDVLAVRELLESYAAFKAAETSTNELIGALEAAIQEMERCVQEGALVEATSADRKFHRLLYEASGNYLLKILGDEIVNAISGPRYSLLRIPGLAQVSLVEHRKILDCIAAGNPEMAMEATRQHLDSARREITADRSHLNDDDLNDLIG